MAFDHNLTSGDPAEKTSILGKIDAFFERERVEASRDDQTPDMDLCIDLWVQGTRGAIELKSERKFTWARKDYKLLSAVFRGEQRVKDLRDLLVHW